MNKATLGLLLVLALGAEASPQGPDDVLRMFKPARTPRAFLMDANGAVVHTWQTAYFGSAAVQLEHEGTLIGVVSATEVQRLSFDGTVLWTYTPPPGLFVHHDLEPLLNGNVLLIVEENKSRAEAIARGRNPATVEAVFQPDAILEVQPTGATSGAIVWEWHVWDHLIQDFDPSAANYGVVGNHPELIDINYPAALFQGNEFNHVNGVDYDPIHDWIALSNPMQSEAWIIDHSTTTAEAAGHTGGRWGKGGDLLYRWGNPAVYRAAPRSAQKLFWPHDPQFVPADYPGAGNLTLFNNRVTPTRSVAIELVLPVDPQGNFILNPGSPYGPTGPVWGYTEPGLYSGTMSGVERLPSGNTLITSAQQAWIFEVTPAGQRVWEHTASQGAMFAAHHTRRNLWASQESLSARAGGMIQFSLVAGTSRATEVYALLGTASGTSPGFALNGVNVPLNIDGYLTSVASSLGMGPFASWVGTLDVQGRGSATYALPPLPFLAGLRLDHAFLSIDATASTVTFASQPVPLAFDP